VTWTQQFTYAQAQRLVFRNLPLVLGNPRLSPGRLRALRVSTRSGARVQWLEVVTTTGTYQCFGDSARWLFGTGRAGPSGLRSTRFSLRTVTDRAGLPRSFVFSGAGHGHGIGLCQWGARGRALAGQSAEEMLAAYYPGAVVTDLRAELAPTPEA
jgi:stage II sporulation protein D